MATEPTLSHRVKSGLLTDNPALVQLLGMCPLLAVTNTVRGALTMGLAVIFVLLGANIVVSLLRRWLQPHLRILVFTMAIATFVTIADYFLKAYLPDMSRLLGPYIPLIIVNCIIISRTESCASKCGLIPSIVDALAMGAGFTWALLLLGGVRELLGTGKILAQTPWEIQVMGSWFTPWGIMILPPGAFLTLGIIIGIGNWLRDKRKGA